MTKKGEMYFNNEENRKSIFTVIPAKAGIQFF